MEVRVFSTAPLLQTPKSVLEKVFIVQSDSPYHIIWSEEPQRLDKALSLSLQDALTREQIKHHIQAHMVTVNDTCVTKPATRINPGDIIKLTPLAPTDIEILPQDIPLDIVFEDAELLVLNKPAGLVVHPGAGNPDGTLVNALLAHCGDSLSGIGGEKRPGIVHRLDKDTSGLMVVAKTDKAHQGLMHQFQDRSLSREYVGFVLGCPNPAEGTIQGNIGRSPQNRQKMALLHHGGKPAITHYEVQELYAPQAGGGVFASKVVCRLETGRTHQIRVHMTAKGHPLLGDPLYGTTQSNKIMGRLIASQHDALTGPKAIWTNTRQALHAQCLKFTHPVTGKKHTFTAEMPEDMQALEALLQEEL